MCEEYCGGPPYGLPVDNETYDRLPEDVKRAWELFDGWWDKVFRSFEVKCVDEKSMPEDVKTAWELMKETVIPGYEDEGFTLTHSCYVTSVQMYFDLYPLADGYPE